MKIRFPLANHDFVSILVHVLEMPLLVVLDVLTDMRSTNDFADYSLESIDWTWCKSLQRKFYITIQMKYKLRFTENKICLLFRH